MSESTGARILIVDDIPDNLKLLRDTLETEGYKVVVAADGPSALRAAKGARPELVLLDVRMPGMDGFEVCRRLKENPQTQRIPVIFITVRDENYSLVQGFQAGGVDYMAKPFEKAEVLARVETHLKISRLSRTLSEKNRVLKREFARYKEEVEARLRAEAAREQTLDALQTADQQLDLISQQEASRWGIEGFVGRSGTIRSILDEVRQVQNVGTTSVLISGESGTGKELIARAIHSGSRRGRGPFVPLNCSAIPGELAESTLFGHLKGAFTGAAADRKGCFELAHGGTLFLDEIGDMPAALQAKLLRVLEDSTFTPVGGTRERCVDVRVVAATNADLQERIACGHFRRDLYFRLARFVVEVPPLRERREDIGLLAQHFLELFAAEMRLPQAALSPEALSVLERYDFPGNVRELKNIVERALIKSGDDLIRPQHLHLLEDPPQAPRREQLVRRVQQRTADREVSAGPDEAGETDEEKILAYLCRRASINNSECRRLLGADYHRASYLLKKMCSYGLLVREGERRWARYRLP